MRLTAIVTGSTSGIGYEIARRPRLGAGQIFRPIAAVPAFSTHAQVVQRANATEHAPAGCVFTQDVDRAPNVADALGTRLAAHQPGRSLQRGSAEGLEECQEIRFYNLARRSTD